jgi:hypothetical protein
MTRPWRQAQPLRVVPLAWVRSLVLPRAMPKLGMAAFLPPGDFPPTADLVQGVK